MALVSACGVFAGVPRLAVADGDGTHAQSAIVHAPGGGILFHGAGFAGRPAGPVVPSRTLEVEDIPEGHVVARAYLYWITLGGADDDGAILNGQAVVGQLIGRSANTCWPGEPYATEGNRVYRADVTALVTANGDYVVEGLPSSLAGVDTQGVELVVIHADPAETAENFRVVVNDGAFTQGIVSDAQGQGSTSFTLALTPHLIPTDFTEASFTILGGDGQDDAVSSVSIVNNASEGRPQFLEENLSNQRDFFDGDLGRYWDDETFDVSDRLEGGETALSWGMASCQSRFVGLLNSCGIAQALDPGDGDCVVYPATFLTLSFPDDDLDGVEDSRDNCILDANEDQANLDGDALGDVCDDDIDGDGASNDEEEDEGSDPLDPDTDGDGDLDGADNCPLIANDDQTDTDGDGLGDVCDDDDDQDGASDDEEEDEGTDPLDPDTDGDGDLDGADNCPLVENEDQTDTDGDGLGDVCDDDDDQDGLDDDEEGPGGTGTDPLDPDSDDDGSLDGDDPCPLDPEDDCPQGEGGAGGAGGGDQGGGDQGGGDQGGGDQGGGDQGGGDQGGGDQGGGTGTNTGSTGTDSGSTGTTQPSGTGGATGAGGADDDLEGLVASGNGLCSAAAGPSPVSPWSLAAFGAIAAALVRRRTRR